MRATIIIPAYNSSRYIETSIASAQNQTERDLEILVVDDCSTDDTAAIVHRMAEGDERIRLQRTLANGGAAVARNIALGSARGDWIVILDSDDWIDRERVRKLLDLGERENADIVVDSLMLTYADGVTPDWPMISRDIVSAPREVTFAEFLERSLGKRGVARGVSWVGLQPAVRRQFMIANGLRFDEHLRFGEDYLLYVRCFQKGARMWITPEPMYYHLVRRGSMTDTPPPADLKYIADVDRELRNDPTVSRDPRLLGALDRHRAVHERWSHYQAFMNAINANDFAEAARVAVRSPASACNIARSLAGALIHVSLQGWNRIIE
jgi:succinoglycan biosynthesis protein ExoO